jgi:hypothetical protein
MKAIGNQPPSLTATNYRSTPAKVGAPQPEPGQPEAAGDQVNLSRQPPSAPSKSLLSRWGKTAAAIALAGLVLGASGCAVTGGVYYEQGYGVTHTYEQTISVGQYQHYNGYGGYGHLHQYNWGSYGTSGYQYYSPAGHGCVANSWGGAVCY